MIETRHLELSREFVKHGYRCIVFTSSFHHSNHEYLYSDSLVDIEKDENIHFIYLKVIPPYQKNDVKRVLSFFSFNFMIEKYSREIAEKYGTPEYIIASSLSPLVWEIGNKCAKKFNSKWVAEIRDFWPLQLTDIMGLPKWHPMVLFFGLIEKRAYQKCNAIAATMPYAHKYICDELGFSRKKVHWLPNGITTERVDANLKDKNIKIPKDLELYLEKYWCCIYCGSLVKSESIPYIVSAFQYLQDHRDIHLAIVGSGHCENEIRETIEKYHLNEQVKIFPRVSYEQIPLILEKVHCCLAALHDFPLYRLGISMLKLNDYLYSGKPTIFACNFRNPVEEIGNLCIPFGDPRLMAEKIIEVKGMTDEELECIREKEQNTVKNVYDYKAIGKQYINLLESL